MNAQDEYKNIDYAEFTKEKAKNNTETAAAEQAVYNHYIGLVTGKDINKFLTYYNGTYTGNRKRKREVNVSYEKTGANSRQGEVQGDSQAEAGSVLLEI